MGSLTKHEIFVKRLWTQLRGHVFPPFEEGPPSTAAPTSAAASSFRWKAKGCASIKSIHGCPRRILEYFGKWINWYLEVISSNDFFSQALIPTTRSSGGRPGKVRSSSLAWFWNSYQYQERFESTAEREREGVGLIPLIRVGQSFTVQGSKTRWLFWYLLSLRSLASRFSYSFSF